MVFRIRRVYDDTIPADKEALRSCLLESWGNMTISVWCNLYGRVP